MVVDGAITVIVGIDCVVVALVVVFDGGGKSSAISGHRTKSSSPRSARSSNEPRGIIPSRSSAVPHTDWSVV